MTTEIAIILDRSGSMQSLLNDAIGGYNAFLAAQRREPGSEATHLTLVLFNNLYQAFQPVPLAEVPDLTPATFLPAGGTALLDAIGRTVSDLTAAFAARPAEARPGKVIIAILTDGEENSSTTYSQLHIADLISAKRELGWEFIFLAADQDAIAAAKTLNIPAGDTFNFTQYTAYTAFEKMATKVSEKRRK